MKRWSASLLVRLALVALAPRAHASEEACYFARSARLAETTTRAGRHVELFDAQLRIDGRFDNACTGLPGSHPVALAPFREGFVVAFVDAPPAYWEAGTYHALDGAPKSPIRALAGSDGVLWIGTATDGLWRMDHGEASRVKHAVLGHGGITALAVDVSGALQVGTDPSGWWVITRDGAVKAKRRDAYAGCFRRTSRGLSPVPPGPGCLDDVYAGTLPSGDVSALALHQGRLYVGTFRSGVFELDASGATRLVEGAPRDVNALLSAGDRLAVGAPDGLYVQVGGSFERATPGPGLFHVNGLARGRDGTIWAATNHGLVGWSDGAVRILDERSGLPSTMVYAVAETEDGAVWAGTANGVARLAADGGVRLFGVDSGRLPHDWVTALLADSTSVYAGTYDAGVARLEATGASHPVDAFERDWINPNGLAWLGGRPAAATMGTGFVVPGSPGAFAVLPSRDVTAVAVHKGVVWIGTRGGIRAQGE